MEIPIFIYVLYFIGVIISIYISTGYVKDSLQKAHEEDESDLISRFVIVIIVIAIVLLIAATSWISVIFMLWAKYSSSKLWI